jgi:hypothetical protein
MGPGMVVHAYKPRFSRDRGGRIIIYGWPGKTTRPYLKNKQKPEGLKAWLHW